MSVEERLVRKLGTFVGENVFLKDPTLIILNDAEPAKVSHRGGRIPVIVKRLHRILDICLPGSLLGSSLHKVATEVAAL